MSVDKMNDYFFSTLEETDRNRTFLKEVSNYANKHKQQFYVLSAPLTDSKYKYSYTDGCILLSSKYKITFFTFKDVEDEDFQDYVDDVLDDVSSISDHYEYKAALGRPRVWRKNLIAELSYDEGMSIRQMLEDIKVDDSRTVRMLDMVISLFIGSINDVATIEVDEPVNLLEKVKHKIQLFDGDQTRFIYGKTNIPGKRVTIQGLSGTGKTELLLHKLKDLYMKEETSKIGFTCHNKVLAEELRKRIPKFFNYMKVAEQIEWDERLWCVNAWGKSADENSGIYSRICHFYGIPFYNYKQQNFKEACSLAISELKKKQKQSNWSFAFTYLFIDESQDFDESFFELCEIVTEKKVYIAGDIFQSIFDVKRADTVRPDFLLSKCYRTDPKTLMFAHALGMGLFEKKKLWWIEKKAWERCGYNVKQDGNELILTREPIRRFEDAGDEYESLKISQTKNFSSSVPSLIKNIKKEYDTLKPDDVCIILIDDANYIYAMADEIEQSVKRSLGWNVNKAYDTKTKVANTLFITNRNNAKGLEFPIVICYTKSIKPMASYRNTLYTMLTRSFIKSYLIFPTGEDTGLNDEIMNGVKSIMESGIMRIAMPTEKEKEEIWTRFDIENQPMSLHDRADKIMNDLKVKPRSREKIFEMIKAMDTEDTYSDEMSDVLEDMIKNALAMVDK
jgi:superfamily I DNA and RNA helicase